MRAAPLALGLALLAGTACRGGSLQPPDAGGGGMLSLDASGDGGGIGGDGTPGASDVRLPTPDANCGSSTLEGQSRPPQMLVLLDQAVAGDPARWSEVIRALTSLVLQNGIRVDWGLYTFPEAGLDCGSDGLSPSFDVPLTPMDYMSEAAAIGAARADRIGSPTAAAIGFGAAYLAALPTDNPGYLMLVTDHAPTCAGTSGALSGDLPRARSDAVAAVAAAAAQGFPTFVLAPSTTTGADADALNALAVAGGYPQFSSGLEFQTELTLNDQFTTTDATCTYPLMWTPPVPDNVTVALNGVAVPRDKSHVSGWDYTDMQHFYIELFGAWCSRLLASRSWQLTILFGCP